MSLCDQCSKPGACCNNFYLNLGTVWEDGWREQAINLLKERDSSTPFIPLRFHLAEIPEPGHAPYGDVFWACPKVTPEGRCSIYENRPQVCRDYAPGKDRLCVMHIPQPTEENNEI